MVEIYLPHKNLGYFGLRIGENFYADISRFGIYWRLGENRYMVTFKRFWKIQKWK